MHPKRTPNCTKHGNASHTYDSDEHTRDGRVFWAGRAIRQAPTDSIPLEKTNAPRDPSSPPHFFSFMALRVFLPFEMACILAAAAACDMQRVRLLARAGWGGRARTRRATIVAVTRARRGARNP